MIYLICQLLSLIAAMINTTNATGSIPIAIETDHQNENEIISRSSESPGNHQLYHELNEVVISLSPFYHRLLFVTGHQIAEFFSKAESCVSYRLRDIEKRREEGLNSGTAIDTPCNGKK